MTQTELNSTKPLKFCEYLIKKLYLHESIVFFSFFLEKKKNERKVLVGLGWRIFKWVNELDLGFEPIN